ncbi:MAG TPA: EF-P lysine aminoacylase GenX, partial [Thiotrichales bacterium]|nr:EF-P lysine aminoacylase GenX [Thiotrichales bacterium]
MKIVETLQTRARVLSEIRTFFAGRGVLEVDTPALSQAGTTDPAIHSLETQLNSQRCFLHTSPEFPMKRLLAAGSGDIYQLCKVFRAGESGRYHNPEFTLLEWYRLGMNHLALAEEVIALIRNLDGDKHKLTGKIISYKELFMSNIGINPLLADRKQLQEVVNNKIPAAPNGLDFDGYLDLLLSHLIVPAFPENQLTVFTDFPASQAALARLNPDQKTAARFEIYWGQLELANGFHELQDAAEQRKRFVAENIQRQQLGLPEIPIDENLLAALESGLPDCAGVALGVDRLLMCLGTKKHINEVLTFPFD